MKIGLPPRGTISYGKYNVQKTDNGVILAGRPIIDAYNYEKKQNWIGIMISPELVGKMISNKNLKILEKHPCIEKCLEIPFHENNSKYNGYVVMPSEKINPSDKEIIEEVRKTIVLLKENMNAAPDIESQIKYKNTLEWLNNYLYESKGPGGKDSPDIWVLLETDEAKKKKDHIEIPISIENRSKVTCNSAIIMFEILDREWKNIRFDGGFADISNINKGRLMYQYNIKNLLGGSSIYIGEMKIPKNNKRVLNISIGASAENMNEHAFRIKIQISKDKIYIKESKQWYKNVLSP